MPLENPTIKPKELPYESQVSEGPALTIAKTEKKVEDLQAQLKELYDKKTTRAENLETIKYCSALWVMDKDQIMAFSLQHKGTKPENRRIQRRYPEQ